MLSTFGLISAGKGIETVIEALPAIVERHPEVVYVVAGRTHPDVAHREGERYRLRLEQTVVDLGLEDHVEFDDRFLAIEEIADLLAATDVFVTPYKGRGSPGIWRASPSEDRGRGVAASYSTPYWYAQDMLASRKPAEIVAVLTTPRRWRRRPASPTDSLPRGPRHGRDRSLQLTWPSGGWPRGDRHAVLGGEAVQLAPATTAGRSPGSTHNS